MKYVTRCDANGALEGTPFPPIWLKRFSEIVPTSIFNLMSRTSKRVHQHLRLNSVWKERAMKLPEYGELSDYEKNVWVASEGFWYEWWCDRVVRVMKRVVPPPLPRVSYDGFGPGMLCVHEAHTPTPNKTVLALLTKITPPTGKVNGEYWVVSTVNTLGEIDSSKVVRFKMITKKRIVVRTNHNTSINIVIIN